MKTRLTMAALVGTLALTAPAQAQPEVDALAQCLADNTTGRDRKDLATWVFLGMAAHPEIQSYAAPSAREAAAESARVMGALVTRLLTESCVDETRAVMPSQGSRALEVAFGKLGELAMQELMTAPAVTTAMGAFERHLDRQRFAALAPGQ